MKTNFRFLSFFLLLLGLGLTSHAQLTGSKSIPSASYPTLKVAIDSLNLYGVGTGGVTFTFATSSTETAPVGGYQLGSATLNASTSASKKVTINGNGAIISGNVGTGSADGIFYIMGTDYVVINGLQLVDPSTNTSTTTQMEWGFSLVKLTNTAPFDGCQYDEINNCTINLTKTNSNAYAIRAAHSIAANTGILTTTGATAASTNSYNKFQGNIINNVTRGISLIGITSGAAVYDKANVIGGSSSTLGNTITAGGSTSTSYSVYTQYDSVITISNNNFYINATQNGSIYHIMPSTGVGDITVTNNRFDVNCAMASSTVYCYYNSQTHYDPTSGLSAASTHTISNNIVTGNNTAATSSSIYGLYEYYAYAKNTIISNNQLRDIDWNTTTGSMYMIYQYYTLSPYVEINNNLIYNISQRPTTSSGFMYCIYAYNAGTAVGKMLVQNNVIRKLKTNYYVYGFYNMASTATPALGAPGHYARMTNNWVDSLDYTTAPGTHYFLSYMYYGNDSTEYSYNKFTNFRGNPTAGTFSCTIYQYGYYAPNLYTVKGNLIDNISCYNLSSTFAIGMYATLSDSNRISNINAPGPSSSITNYVGYYSSKYISSNNRLTDYNLGGGSMYTYMGYYGTDAMVRNNAITRITMGGTGSLYNYIGYGPGGNSEVHHCRVDSITMGTGTGFYPWYSYANGSLSLHDNIVSNLTTASTSLTLYPYYLTSSSSTNPTTFYNNFLTNINLPAAYANTNSAGIYCASASPYTLFHNTIRINPGIAGGTPYGFTGIYYQTSGNFDLRNNIINVNVTPTSGGFTTALRRAGGTAGTSPANFMGTSNGNLYYAPTAANSWFYGEGTSAAGMVNTYSLTNDPAFNTACGLFKNFMGHDQASFWENNLVAGSFAGTYVPTGNSYAEKGAVPTTNPTVATDFLNITRGSVADIGALEFSGNNIDNAPPIISYTPVPIQTYCTSEPTLLVTITDNSGVNTTPLAGAPRLYYKKSSENNAFSTTNNTSTFNGWKWVEPTSVSGSVYTFDFKYSLLTSAVAPGDYITYFVIAQDLATPVNAGASVIGFPVCPTSVLLSSTNAPTNASPVPNGFRILNAPTFVATSFPSSSCGPGSTNYTINPFPYGAGVQWQSSTLTGSFANIPGATSPTYSTPTNTTTMRYRALILCGTSTLATTPPDTFVIAQPAILSVKGDTVCGYDTMFLSATVSPFTTAKWYTSATGGTAFYQGNTYTVNPRMSSVTYYLGANTPNAGQEILNPPVAAAPYSYTMASGYGLELVFKNASTHFYQTTIYPYNAGVGSSFDLELQDEFGNTVPASQGGPYIVTGIPVTGGAGSTPQVVNLPFRNIKAGKYHLVMTNPVNTPYLNYQYIYNTPLPSSTPSGNVTAVNGLYGGSYNYYWMFFYNNVFGTDCESTAPRVAVTGVVTPPPAISVTSSNVPGICIGGTATIGVTSPNTSYTYKWTTKPAGTTMTGATQTVSPALTTTYDLVATDPYTGCMNHDTILMNVSPVPNVPAITPVNPTTCGGKPVQLTSSIPGSSGVATLGTGTTVMSVPGPFYGGWTGNRSQYLIKASELYAAGIQPGRLISLAFQSSGTGYTLNNFEIRLANVPSMTALPSSISCFSGLTLVYQQATLVPPSSGWTTFIFNQPTSFLWSGGDLVVDIQNMNCPNCPTTACTAYGSSASVYGSAVGYQSTFHVYYDGNCGVLACPTTGSFISASSTNRPNMQIGFRDPSVINWQNVTRLFKTASLSGPMTTTDTNSVVYSAPTVNTVYTTVSNYLGCLSAPSKPDTVFVTPSPVVTVVPAGPQTICAGQPVTLCIPSAINQTYQWYLNNVAIAGANANCYVAGAAGNYRVAATNTVTGCSDTSIVTVLTVNPAPVVTISANGPLTFCNGGSVVLTSNSATAAAWQWQLNGTNIAGAQTSSYTATASGSYTVVVTNGTSCTTTSTPTVVTVNTTPGTISPQGSTSFCTGGSVVLQAPTGTGFTYQWYFAGAPISGATSSSYSATASGNYYVEVTNGTTGCMTQSPPIPVTAGAGPNASITPQGTIAGCQNGMVALHAIAQPGLCYQWYRNGSSVPGGNLDSLVTNIAGNYTVEVTICSQTTCKSTTTSPTVLAINPLPNVTVSPATVAPFCQGDSAVLTANTGANQSYQWLQNGLPISGATASTFAVRSNGSYQVQITNTVTGCSDTSLSKAITVNPAPNSTITPATNPTFCQGGSVVLNASTTGITGYQWYLNGVAITTGGTGSSYTANSTGLYTVKVTGSNSCTATSQSTSVQVNALPDVTTIPTGAAAVCQGYTTLLSVPSGPGLSYQWYNGVNAIAGATTNSYTTGTAGSYTVKVTNTVTGCFATSNAIVLSVNTPPPATASATGSTTICQNDSVKLSANTGAGYIYQWKLNGVDIPGTIGTANVFYAKVAGRYTVSVSNATNCTTLSNSIVIVVNPRPAAYITYNTPLEFCDGSAVVLNANSGTGLTYQWYMDGVALPNTSDINISSVSGAYTLKVTNSFGCVNTADTLVVTVWPTPTPAIVRNGGDLNTTQPYASYQWFYNNNAIGGATSATYTFTQNGAYKVRVTDDNGCEGYSGQYFVNNVGIAQTSASRSIKIYPNPSSSIVHIDASVKIQVTLRDVTGRSVLEAKDVKEIDLADIATGPYLIYISDMEGHLLRVEKLTRSER